VTYVKTPVKIRVDLSTRKALKDIGRKGESYDAVIRRLIDYCIKAELRGAVTPIRLLQDMEEEVGD